MTIKNKRMHERIEIRNIVSFICLDEYCHELSQGAGEAINISCGGMQLSTHLPIESEFILLLSFNLQDDIFDIKGKVIYSKSFGPGNYRSGIEFVDPSGEIINNISQLVEAHQIQNERVNLNSNSHNRKLGKALNRI